MMKRNLSFLLRLLPSVALLAVLAACGGGGGGGTSAPSETTVAAASPASVSVNVSAPIALVSSTYVLGSEDLAAFNLLNFERNNCGFGVLLQNAQLDAAAKSHADYQILNDVVSHTETAATPGFTGVMPLDRVVAKGYTLSGGVTDEIVSVTGTSEKAGYGSSGVRGLLNAPYHLRGLVSGYRDVGISVRSNADVGTGPATVILQIDAAYKASVGPQVLGASDVKTYPCEGSTGVNRQLLNETPNPIPGRNLALNPLGSIIYVSVREGNTLTLTTTAMTQVSTGQSITLRPPVTAATDPYRGCAEGCFKGHQAYFAADTPLLPNTAYRVVINGSNISSSGTAPFSRTFVFTTGSGV